MHDYDKIKIDKQACLETGRLFYFSGDKGH
jgi:hypothetical protein